MIRLRDVTVAYGDRVILDNINLDIHQGETLQDIEPLTLVLDFLERFPRLIYRSPHPQIHTAPNATFTRIFSVL